MTLPAPKPASHASVMLPGQTLTLIGWLATVAAAIGFLWWGVERTLAERKASEQALVMQQAAARAASYAQQLEDLTDRMDQVAEQIIAQWRQSPGSVNIRDSLTGLLSTRHQIYVFILDVDGRVIASSFPPKVRTIPRMEFFEALESGCCNGWQVTPASFAPTVGGEVIRFSRRLDRPDGSFGGALVFAAPPNFLETFQDNSVIGPRDFVTVRVIDGPVLTTKLGAGQPRRIFYLDHPRFPEARGVRHEASEKFKDGFARYIGWQKHSALPIVALAAMAEADALVEFDNTAQAYRSFASVASAALLLVGMLMVVLTLKLNARRAAEEEVRRTYRMATDAANEGFYMLRPVFDKRGMLSDLLVEDCNERAASLFGMARAELLGRLASAALDPDLCARMMETGERAIRFGTVEDELRIPAESQLKASWIYRRAVYAGAGIALTLRDISESKAHEEELRRLATHDALTGLPNRLWLTHQLPISIDRARRSHGRVALLFIDLDNFKLVNDTLGHAAGDALLVEVAARLRSAVRASDHVARLGGDEFTVVLEQVDERETVGQIAQKIIGTLSAPYPSLGEAASRVSASIGASLYPDDAASPDALLKNADIAMYASKAGGKARFAEYEARMSEALLAGADSAPRPMPAS